MEVFPTLDFVAIGDLGRIQQMTRAINQSPKNKQIERCIFVVVITSLFGVGRLWSGNLNFSLCFYLMRKIYDSAKRYVKADTSARHQRILMCAKSRLPLNLFFVVLRPQLLTVSTMYCDSCQEVYFITGTQAQYDFSIDKVGFLVLSEL
jgi:hypothetical protein